MSRHARTARTARSSIRTGLRHRAAAVVLVLAVGPLAAGCAGDDTAGDGAGTSDGTSVLPTDPGTTEGGMELGTLSAPDVRPDGVLIAALLLGAGGDVEEAVAGGLVTPAEVDAAAAALADGTLDAWVVEAGVPAG